MISDRIKLILAAIALAAAAAGGWTVNGWRLGTKLEHVERERDLAIAQGKVLAAATRACSASVEQGRKLGELVVGQIRDHLAEIRKLHAGSAKTVDRIEQLLGQPTPAGAGCDKAWDAIEAERKARAP